MYPNNHSGQGAGGHYRRHGRHHNNYHHDIQYPYLSLLQPTGCPLILKRLITGSSIRYIATLCLPTGAALLVYVSFLQDTIAIVINTD
jgi:hypothetical protein